MFSGRGPCVVTHPEESYSAVCLSAIVKPGQGRDPGPVGAVASCGGDPSFFVILLSRTAYL